MGSENKHYKRRRKPMHRLLTKALSLSEEITTLMEQSEWQDILTLSELRQQCIDEYARIAPAPDSPAIIATVMNEILSFDEGTRQKIDMRKQAMIDNSLSLSNVRNAINHYQHVQTN